MLGIQSPNQLHPFQFSFLTDCMGRRRIRDDSADILLLSFQQEAVANSSGMGRQGRRFFGAVHQLHQEVNNNNSNNQAYSSELCVTLSPQPAQ